MTEKIIATTTDPEGRTIHLYQGTWEHVKRNHPEMRTTIQQIRSIIQRPDFITEISTRTSLAYSRTSSISLYTNVYAKMDDKYEEGRVSTVFVQKKPPKGDTIWYRKA